MVVSVSRMRASSFGLGGRGQHGEDDAGTAFLHLHGDAKGIEGTGREQLLLHVGEELGIHVVEIGFEDSDGVILVPTFAPKRLAQMWATCVQMWATRFHYSPRVRRTTLAEPGKSRAPAP